MSPSAPSAEAADLPADVPHHLLDDGEVILLAVRPSAWFVLLLSWPAVVLAALVLAAISITVDVLNLPLPTERQLLALGCLAAVALRLSVALLQWIGRLYLLTDRRVLRIGGLFRGDIAQMSLKDIEQTSASASTGERAVNVGSIHFCGPDGLIPEVSWLHINNVEEARRIIDETLSQSRKRP